VNGVDPTGLCTIAGEGQLYAGPCATTGAEAIAAEKGIQAHASGGGFSFSAGFHAVASVADDVGDAVVHHPLQVAGLALGALSIATGVGALAGGFEIASIGVDLSATSAGTISAIAGGIGSAIDIPGCAQHDEVACLAVGLNGLGAALGGSGVLAGEGALGAFLGAFGINVAGAGLTLDTFESLSGILASGSSKGLC